MSRKRKYKEQDHKNAYETWHETKNMSEVARMLQCTHTTPYRWKDKDYKCEFNCPWHGWEELEHEILKTKQVRQKLVEEGEYDPITHEIEMRKAITKDPGKTRDKDGKLMMSILTDLELAADAQYMYNKAFYAATGIAREYKFLKDPNAIDLEEQYKQGLRPNTFKEAWQVMREAIQDIDKYTAVTREAQAQQETKEIDAEISSTGIDVLRELKKRIKAGDLPQDELEKQVKVIDVAARGRTVEDD